MNNKISRTGQLSLFSLIIGLAAGVIETIFGRVLLAIGTIRTDYFSYLIPLLSLAGLLIIFVYQKWGKSVESGMNLVFQAGQGQDTTISPILIPLITTTTWLGHLVGASVGREGVAVQLGASMSHWLGKHWKSALPKDTMTQIGMAAGFAGLFQTPLAASLFAVEVLVVGSISWVALPYCLLAAIIASSTSHWLGLEKFSHSLSASPFQFEDLFKWMLVAICLGLIGNCFAWILTHAKAEISTILPNPYWRMLALGLLLSLFLYLAHLGRYSGLGTNLIEASLSGNTIFAYDWLLKLVFTCLCLIAGFQGGEVTPLFAIGASAGLVLAQWLGLPPELVAALGYCAVFGTATNTLLAPILISYEVFGSAILPYALPVLGVAYFLNRKQTIYGQQIH
ncbi:chloride channel protein [Streptococcus sp. ZY1909104]|uniref:chloride channel protein n=1 Tax=Streptococcus TaxID=1301 RepID=UPI001478CB14|nr:chloride channel protein [Streptococcus suis]